MSYKNEVFETNQETAIMCPDCKVPMIFKTNRINGSQFLGCPNYPTCNITKKIPESWILEKQGHPKLF